MTSTPVDRVNWRQGLDVLREAKSVGVKLSPEVMVVLLSRIPPGNSRKVIGRKIVGSNVLRDPVAKMKCCTV